MSSIKSSPKILIINGPNLDLLGTREPEIYGSKTLVEIQDWTTKSLKAMGINYDFIWKQSNSETEIIEILHSINQSNPNNQSNNKIDGLIINPAGLSHTSVILLDALLALKPLPIIEVHLSNPCAREEFRRSLLTAKAATIIMSGLGDRVYFHAIFALHESYLKIQ